MSHWFHVYSIVKCCMVTDGGYTCVEHDIIYRLVHFLFLFDFSILRSKLLATLLNLLFRGVNSPTRSRNSVQITCIFFGLKHMLFNDNGSSREVSPLLIFKKWGKILCSRMVIIQKWWYGKHGEIFACCIRIKFWFWSRTIWVLCSVFSDIHGQCLLQEVICDCSPWTTILKRVWRHYSPPFLPNSWCQVCQERSVQKETVHLITAISYYHIRYSRQS